MSKKMPIDFNDPDALNAELAAIEAAPEGEPKKKERKPRVIKVNFTADRDILAGETIEFDYALPVGTAVRGQVAGIPLDEMSNDQLKIEHRNANSVYYKQKKAGKLSAHAEERLAAVKTEMEKRGIQPSDRKVAVVDAAAIAELIKSGKISVDDIQKMLDASV